MTGPRRGPAGSVIGTVVVGALLVGCAATVPTLDPPALSPVEDGCADPGPASEAVTASGALGASPVIAADGPFTVDRVQRSVLVLGEGETVQTGDLVQVAFTMLNATTGDLAPGLVQTRVLVREGAALPGLLEAIVCTPVGSRVAAVLPAEAAFGDVGQPDLAIGPGDDVVIVLDLLAVIPLQASGSAGRLPEGFPALAIQTDATGRPTVGIPPVDPPTSIQTARLITGTGRPAAVGDEVLVQFQAVNWRTGEVFDQTWGDAPRSLLHIVPGVDSALAGTPVGSRLVVICPPDAAFGSAGDPPSGVLGTDTVVYVVDLLATTPPPA